MSIAVTANLERVPINPLLTRLAVAAACTALADWLFFGWDAGISLALFLGVVGIATVACNGVRATRPVQIIMSIALVAGLAALIEDVSTLSVMVGTLATAMFSIVMTASELSWRRDLWDAVTLPFRGPFRLIGDDIGALRQMKPQTAWWQGSLVAWIIPVSIFAIFLYLFASANPLIEEQLNRIDFKALAALFDPWRVAFWIAVLCAIWPLIHRRLRRKPVPQIGTDSRANIVDSPGLDHLLGETALSRSLVLFNLLFALQSALDLTYLWGGATLPHGMSHAEYAHRGAYPLVVTALLAAGFVLIAMRPGGPAEHSRLIRPLVLLWTAQNVLLVISSIFRLDLYVAAYSLTYLRLAAFIWMALVATGLVLMFIQMVWRKSTSWLLAANAISLSLVLYGCCFLNAPPLIAAYNISHSSDISGKGPSLDLQYLRQLGPAALPVVEQRLRTIPALRPWLMGLRQWENVSQMTPTNWRTWTFRTWRLERYFANTPARQFDVDTDRG